MGCGLHGAPGRITEAAQVGEPTTALRYPIALFWFRLAYQDFVVGAPTTSTELLVIEALRRWADLHQLPMLLTLHHPFFPHPRGAEHPRVGRQRPRHTSNDRETKRICRP